MPLSRATAAQGRGQRTLARETQLDQVFHALSDRTRRAMVTRLTEGEASISELAAPFDMSLPGASKHVRVLEEAGLVVRTVDGRVHRVELQAAPLDEAAAWVTRQRSFWSETLDALARYAGRARRR
jgi:DNA-binding transcriptional ArsR family regulator